MVKPFRFGVQCGGDHDRSSWQQLAHKIEALGYATVYLPDHFIDTQMAPMVGMAVAAEATKTLRVGALGLRQRLQAPGDPGQGDRDPRPALGRPGRAGDRRRLDEGRLRRARAAVRPGRGARRPAGGGARRHQGDRGVRIRSASKAPTTRSPTTTASRSRRSSRTHRSSSVVAGRAFCDSPAARPTSSGSTPTCGRAR